MLSEKETCGSKKWQRGDKAAKAREGATEARDIGWCQRGWKSDLGRRQHLQSLAATECPPTTLLPSRLRKRRGHVREENNHTEEVTTGNDHIIALGWGIALGIDAMMSSIGSVSGAWGSAWGSAWSTALALANLRPTGCARICIGTAGTAGTAAAIVLAGCGGAGRYVKHCKWRWPIEELLELHTSLAAGVRRDLRCVQPMINIDEQVAQCPPRNESRGGRKEIGFEGHLLHLVVNTWLLQPDTSAVSTQDTESSCEEQRGRAQARLLKRVRRARLAARAHSHAHQQMCRRERGTEVQREVQRYRERELVESKGQERERRRAENMHQGLTGRRLPQSQSRCIGPSQPGNQRRP